METKLRQKLQDEVNKMQVQLQEEQSKAEAEFNRKRNMVSRLLFFNLTSGRRDSVLYVKVLKQREDFEKKKAEEMEQLDNLEKARILSNFEKEHAAAQDVLDQDRKNKKAKLADRLQKYVPPCAFMDMCNLMCDWVFYNSLQEEVFHPPLVALGRFEAQPRTSVRRLRNLADHRRADQLRFSEIQQGSPLTRPQSQEEQQGGSGVRSSH